MNKQSKLLVLMLAGLATACQSLPGSSSHEAATARAEAKPTEVKITVEQKMAEAKPAAEQKAEAKVEQKVEQKAEAKPANDGASMITPMLDRQATVRGTGYAVISTQNHKNAAQQRLMAIRASKLDAYRALTEQVYGQQLDATTTVAEMMVTSDTFRTRVQGIIYGAVLESITPVGDDTYETTLSLDGRVVNDLRVLYVAQMSARAR
jgi:hypothetical protein